MIASTFGMKLPQSRKTSGLQASCCSGVPCANAWFGPMIDKARPSEEKSDEMLGLRLAVGRACKAYADQLKAKNPRDTQIRKLLSDGRKYVTYVTRFANDYQEAARRLLPELAGGDAEVTARPEPKTFAEAKNAAKDSIDQMQTANLLLKTLPGRIATLKSPERDSIG